MTLPATIEADGTVRLWRAVHPDIMHAHPGSLMAALGDAIAEERMRQLFENTGLRSMSGGTATAWAMTATGRTSLLNGTFDIDTDSWKCALFLSTSNIGAASTTFAGITNEVATAFGYTAGGIAITLTLAGTTTVTIDIASDPVWTAAGGSITGRFAGIYEVAGNLLFYSTLDSTPQDVTATDGNTLTVAANASGLATLA